MKEVKAYELRNKTKSELVSQLGDLKSELQSLRIAQVTGGAPAKLAKIGTIRKSIARVLTVTNQITKNKVRQQLTVTAPDCPNPIVTFCSLFITAEREVRW